MQDAANPPEGFEGFCKSLPAWPNWKQTSPPAPRRRCPDQGGFLPGIPSGPTYSGRSPTVIRRQALSLRSQPAFVCGRRRHRPFRRRHPHPHRRRCLSTAMPRVYLPGPMSDRDYAVEMGYRKVGGADFRWLLRIGPGLPALHPTSRSLIKKFVSFLAGISHQQAATPPFSAPVETA